MKKTTILMTFCLTAAMLFSSCEIFKKDDLLREDIVGEWDITSFTIDGVEAKGSVIKNSKMEFEKYSGNSGDFEWTITYADGTVAVSYTHLDVYKRQSFSDLTRCSSRSRRRVK